MSLFAHLRRREPAAAHPAITALMAFAVSVSICVVSPGSPAMASGLHDHVQSVLDDLHERYGFPGATAAYMLSDGTIGTVATGFADLEQSLPMTADSRMLAASIGKSMVGATVVALAKAGVLDMDEPVSHWLGAQEWFARLPNHETMTIRHLLQHTSGLPDHVYSVEFGSLVATTYQNMENAVAPEQLIGFILDAPAHFPAGEGWSYSDTGYLLLGLVIEIASGRSYDEEIDQRFLLRLNLKHTSRSDRRDIDGLAAGYTAEDNPFDLPVRTTDNAGVLLWHPGLEWTGGGLASTSRDLATWGWALFEGHAMPVDYLDEVLTAAQIDPDMPGTDYGAGIVIVQDGDFGPVYGHGGWIPGYVSSMRYYPEHRATIAFQINSDVAVMEGSPSVVDRMETELAAAVLTWTAR